MWTVNKSQLGRDVCEAISRGKHSAITGTAREHNGHELRREVNKLAPEGRLHEIYVGQDRDGSPGNRRIVFYVEGAIVKRVFFSNGHYERGTWCEVTGW